MVRLIAEAHGGAVHVEPLAGGDVRYTVALPPSHAAAATRAARRCPSPSPEAPPAKRPRLGSP